MVRLSSNDLNERLKKKLYSEVFSDVIKHVDANPEDVESAGKFCNALAYHLFYNSLQDDQAAAKLAAESVVKCYDLFKAAAERKKMDEAALKKATEASGNIVFKGFLRDYCAKATIAVSQCLAGFFKDLSPELAKSFALLPELVKAADRASASHPQVAKEVKRQLKSNTLLQKVPALRAAHILQLQLEILVLEGKATKGIKVVKEAFEILDVIEKILQSKEKSSSWQPLKEKSVPVLKELVVLQCCKLADILSGPQALETLERATKLLKSLSKDNPAYPPSSRTVGCFVSACELHLDLGEGEKAKGCLDDMDVFISAKENASHSVDVLRAAKEFLLVRVQYQSFTQEVSQEMKEKEIQENQMAEAKGDADDAREIGDCNPYIVGLSLEKEEEIVLGLSRSANHFRKALAQGPKTFTGLPGGHLAILRIILSAVYFFSLLGQHEKSREAAMLLFKYAEGCQHQYFKINSASVLLAMDRGVDKEIEKVCKATVAQLAEASTLKDSSTLLLLVPAAQAWRDYHNCNFTRASQIAGELLRREKTMKSGGLSRKILCADLYRLLSLINSTSGSFVTYPAPDPLPARCGGLKEIVESGSLEHISEAFKNSVTAEYNTRLNVKDRAYAEGFFEHLKAAKIHTEVLATRLSLYSSLKLPKEMRLYMKLKYKSVGKYGLSFRSAESLLTMCEIDLQCDEPAQAKVKLDAAKRIISLLVEDSGLEKGGKKTKRAAGAPQGDPGASPMLRRSDFHTPCWLDHPQECDCYPCSNPLFLGVTVQYFNCVGVWHHLNSDLEAAAAFFEGTLGLVRKAQRRLSAKEKEGLMPSTKEEVISTWLNCLQWQVECYGRDEYLSKCEELLQVQLTLARQMPKGFLLKNVHLKSRLSHLSHMLRLAEDPLELSGLETKMSKCMLTPNVPRKKAGEEEQDKFKTPAVRKSTRAAPRRPTKKLIPQP